MSRNLKNLRQTRPKRRHTRDDRDDETTPLKRKDDKIEANICDLQCIAHVYFKVQSLCRDRNVCADRPIADQWTTIVVYCSRVTDTYSPSVHSKNYFIRHVNLFAKIMMFLNRSQWDHSESIKFFLIAYLFEKLEHFLSFWFSPGKIIKGYLIFGENWVFLCFFTHEWWNSIMVLLQTW